MIETTAFDATANASRDVRTANASQIRATQYVSQIIITLGSVEVPGLREGGISARAEWTLRMTKPGCLL